MSLCCCCSNVLAIVEGFIPGNDAVRNLTRCMCSVGIPVCGGLTCPAALIQHEESAKEGGRMPSASRDSHYLVLLKRCNRNMDIGGLTNVHKDGNQTECSYCCSYCCISSGSAARSSWKSHNAAAELCVFLKFTINGV